MSRALVKPETEQTIQAARPDFLAIGAALGFDEATFAAECGFARQVIAASGASLENTASSNPESLVSAIVQVASVGLSLNPARGLAYLIPRGGKVCYAPSFKGLAQLAVDTGLVSRIDSAVVHAADTFDLTLGTQPEVVHRPELRGDRGEIVGAYAVAYMTDGARMVEYMTEDELAACRSCAQSAAVWNKWPVPMRRKAVIRRLSNYLPRSAPRFAAALAAVDEADGNHLEREPVDVTPSPSVIGEEELAAIREAIDAIAFDDEDAARIEARVCAAFGGVASIADIPQSRARECMVRLKGLAETRGKMAETRDEIATKLGELCAAAGLEESSALLAVSGIVRRESWQLSAAPVEDIDGALRKLSATQLAKAAEVVDDLYNGLSGEGAFRAIVEAGR